MESGVDYVGNDIKSYTESSTRECQSYCDINPICVGVVVSSSTSGACWLKRAFKIANPSNKIVFRKTSMEKAVVTNPNPTPTFVQNKIPVHQTDASNLPGVDPKTGASSPSVSPPSISQTVAIQQV